MSIVTPSIKRRGCIAAAIFAVIAANAAVIGSADELADVPQVVVRYGDLKLSSPEGANALYTRIRAAAEQVCRPFDRRDLRSQVQMKGCVTTAVADAVTKVGHPAVVAIYNAKHASPLPTMVLAKQDR